MKIKDIDKIIMETVSEKIKSDIVKESVEKYMVTSENGTPLESFNTHEEAQDFVNKNNKKEKLLIDKKTYGSYDDMLEDLDSYSDKLEENEIKNMKNKTNRSQKNSGFMKNESVLLLARMAMNEQKRATKDLITIVESYDNKVPLSDVMTVLNYYKLDNLKKKITLKESDLMEYEPEYKDIELTGSDRDPYKDMSDEEYEEFMRNREKNMTLPDDRLFTDKDLYDIGAPVKMFKSDVLNPVQKSYKKTVSVSDDEGDDEGSEETGDEYGDMPIDEPSSEFSDEPSYEDMSKGEKEMRKYSEELPSSYDDDLSFVDDLSEIDELGEEEMFDDSEEAKLRKLMDRFKSDENPEMSEEEMYEGGNWEDFNEEEMYEGDMMDKLGEEDMYEDDYNEEKSMCSECGSMLNEYGMCSECEYKKGGMDEELYESKKKKIRLKESELVELIQKMINESVPGLSVTEKNRKVSGKDSKNYLKDVESKMKGTRKFTGNDNPKFPKQIGKGEKVARQNSTEEDKIMSNYRGGGMEDLKYDTKPSKSFEERAKKSLVGDSKMGNSQDSPNVVKSDLGEKIHKKAQDKKKTQEKEFKVSWGHSWKEPENVNVVKESKDLSNKVLNEEIKRIKDMALYNKKTQ